jgi:outer membrane immunogenic protein
MLRQMVQTWMALMLKAALSLAAAVTAALVATPAGAADMAVKAPVAPVPVSTWTGCYVGGNMGGDWASSHWTYRNVNPYDALGPGAPIIGTDNSFRMSGVIAGVQGGCNVQFANVVLGVEASWSGTHMNQTVPNVVQVFAPFATQTVQTSIDSMYTVAGRLGYVFAPAWMGYVKGGYAAARIDTAGFTDALPAFNWQSSAWHSGFVAGTGVEYKVMPHMVVGVEYDYVSLDTKDQTGVIGFGFPAAFNPVAGVRANVQSVTARINYLFGPGQ